MSLRRIKCIVQFDGKPYWGWQFQPGGPTLQQTLEETLGQMLDRRIQVFAAGRTDAGVHAMAMPFHFDTDHPIPADKLPIAMKQFLPPSISILEATDAPPGFDARRSAVLRWYRYQVYLSRLPQPLGPRAWHVHRPLDVEAVEAVLPLLHGSHNFHGFRSSHCQAKRTHLTMLEVSLSRSGNMLAFDFKCRSFLHHMIRFITGTLVALGVGALDRERLLRILELGDRPQLVFCAPPEGLCLMGVAYTPQEKQRMLDAHPPLPSF